MKRTLIFALSLALLFTLAACGGQESNPSAQAPDAVESTTTEPDTPAAPAAPTPAAHSKYVLTYRDCPLPMNAEFAPLLDFLGEPDSYFEAASCAFDGLDKTYTYAGLEIITYPDGDRDFISSVRILDNSVATPEGITIGSARDDVAAACGENFQEIGKQYVYADGDAELSVLFDDGGAAVSVEYTAINDLLG